MALTELAAEEECVSLTEELSRIVARIAIARPGLDIASIELAVMRAAGQFDQATVRRFLLILIERRVRAELDLALAEPASGSRDPDVKQPLVGTVRDTG